MLILGAVRTHFPVVWECPGGWSLAGDSTSQIQPVRGSHLLCSMLFLSYLTWDPQKPPPGRGSTVGEGKGGGPRSDEMLISLPNLPTALWREVRMS